MANIGSRRDVSFCGRVDVSIYLDNAAGFCAALHDEKEQNMKLKEGEINAEQI